MKLTKKFKKMMTLSVLGITAVILAGIAGTKVIKTGVTLQSAKDGVTEGYVQQVESDALESQANEELNNQESISTLSDEAMLLADSGFTTEAGLAIRK